MNPIPTNKSLYAYVKRLAHDKFQSKSGVYRSSWIVREYKKRGGLYHGTPSKNSGTLRWYKEKWVDLNRPILNSKGTITGYKSCGRANTHQKGYPLCRPTTKITSRTPKTYKEISKNNIQKAKRAKSKIKGNGNIKFGGSCSYMCGGKPQYRGRKSSVMVKVPINVKKWAIYAFKLKKQGFQGATKTGWLRARQLATQETIPIEDVRYMRNWFARHIVTSYPGFRKWEKAGRPKDSSWHKKHAIVSWVTWAGNAGFKWVNSQYVISKLNTHFGTNYTTIKGKSKV